MLILNSQIPSTWENKHNRCLFENTNTSHTQYICRTHTVPGTVLVLPAACGTYTSLPFFVNILCSKFCFCKMHYIVINDAHKHISLMWTRFFKNTCLFLYKIKSQKTTSVSLQCRSNLLLIQGFIQHRVHLTKRKNIVDDLKYAYKNMNKKKLTLLFRLL